MTNEQAIELIMSLKWDKNIDEQEDKALSMAIEALSNTPNTLKALECVKLDNNSTKVVNENDELVRKMDDLKVTERKIIYLDDAINVIDNHQFSIEYCKEHNIDRAIDVSMTKIALEKLPSAQPEIIRCKDCKHMTEHYDTDGNAPYWTCSEWDSGTDYDGFCHYAERRTDEIN